MLWFIPAAGLLLSLAFPNDIIPGHAGDHPPFYLAWIALLPLWWGMLALPRRHARWAVWLYGFVFYLGTLSWVRIFGYLPWLLLAAYLSLTPLLALLATQRMPGRRWMAPLGFAFVWTGLEWLRGQGTFAFAWSELGSSQVDGIAAWMAALGGIHLITFLMLWVTGALVFHLFDRTTPRWIFPLSLLVLGGCLLGGWQQTHSAVQRWRGHSQRLTISVIQPSTQRGLNADDLVRERTPEEWLAESQRRLDDLLRLSNRAAGSTPAHTPHLMIWSESALPYYPDTDPIRAFCRQTDTMLLVGGPWVYFDPGTTKGHARNAAFLLTPDGKQNDRYDKIHLVPFGEFVPFRSLVARYYSVRNSDIVPGTQRKVLNAAGHRIGVGICFESTFPSIARAYARQGAGMLTYMTNDAWFHRTCAVRQHFNHARFRAIESGLPVARTASTGISGFIAPDGHILGEIPVYRADTLTYAMPEGLPGTLYSSIGWVFAPVCLFVWVGLVFVGIVKGRNAKKGS